MARRMLKTWAIWGLFETSRGDHIKAWDDVVHQFQSGLIPMECDLDDAAIESWNYEGLVAPVEIDPPRPTGASGRDILGGICSGVPSDLHERMVTLAMTGEVPITTRVQRNRYKNPKRDFRVPPDLADALAHGYLHPNLPPPRGLIWKCSAGRWVLMPRGG